MADLLGTLAGPLVSGGLNLLGGILGQDVSANSIAKQEQFQSGEVQQQEQFQEMMSNTAYQRATQDMSKAGINPILAYSQGGATTPGGSSASGANMQGQNIIGNSVSSGLSTAQQLAQISNTMAQTENTVAQIPGTQGKSNVQELEGSIAGMIDNFIKPLNLPSTASKLGKDFDLGVNNLTGGRFKSDLSYDDLEYSGVPSSASSSVSDFANAGKSWW